MAKDIYLDNVPLQAALEKWLKRVDLLANRDLLKVTVKTGESLHRVSAEPVNARVSSPFYHSAAMDGYAVDFNETFGASEAGPKRLSIPERAVYVDTGDPMPDGLNAVIKIEDINIIEKNGEEHIEIISPVTPWENVRVIGEDIVVTELILPENSRIRPVDQAAMLAGGIREVVVKKKPTVSVIPTGDEIVNYDSELRLGHIIDTNSWMLAGYLVEDGAVPDRRPVIRDKKDEIRRAIKDAVSESDIVLVIAGSSAGIEDFTSDVIRDLGEVLVHGVNIKPGKPVILGVVDNTPVVGIPGYPVSAFIAYNYFVKPVLDEYFGTGRQTPEIINARLSRPVSSSLGTEEFVRMKLGDVSGTIIATPVSRGAGLIMSLVRADGIMRIPPMSEGFGAGTDVDVEMVRDRRDIRNTIVCIGSHDNSLDVIANYLKKRYPEYSLSSAHTGSMGGIMALRKNEAHIAGSHLLDEDTGNYNVPSIKRLLDGIRLKVINLVYREQGLFVRKGNPKQIKSIEDLVRDDVVFINRQSGSGTRLLTDKRLKDCNIDKADIRGYDRVEFTHMSVASSVKSGVADIGVGIYAASVALDLDFIPMAKERYDIIVPEEFIEDDKIKAFIDIIENDKEFRAAVERLGGYDVADMGKVIFEQ